MKRLTEPLETHNSGYKYRFTDTTKALKYDLLHKAVLNKLGAYEDTGLTPGEIESLNTFDGSQAVKATILLQEEQNKHHWIPVAERLPRDKGEYLVTYHPCYWDNVASDVCTGIDTFRGKSTWAKKKYQRVIAWMPKPEVYREGK